MWEAFPPRILPPDQVMNNSPGVKMKFCESLDRFVAIRTFSPQQKKELIQNVKINDKNSYKRLIINAAVVNYLDEIAPMIFGGNDDLLGGIIEEELYNLCIKVNPSLDIKEVTIPLTGEDAGAEIPLLDAGQELETVSEAARVLNLERDIKRRLIGQDQAVEAVCLAIRKAKAGLRNPRRPVGSFIFVGQTGVGKTELSKALAHCLFGNEMNIVRIDCSEYAMSHEYSKLIGAPPGYIGHNDGGYLTEAVKNKPQAVVVFDEIEKAHRKVHNLLLQVLDEGILTDSKGTQVSFTDTVVIMTSNVGVESLMKLESAIGFAEQKAKIDDDLKSVETRKALEKIFPPEFLNRVDEVVMFRALSREHNLQIIDLMLGEVADRLRNLGLTIHFDDDSRSFLVDHGTDEKYGARPLRRAISKFVENPLAELILSNTLRKGHHIEAKVDGQVADKLSFTSRSSQ